MQPQDQQVSPAPFGTSDPNYGFIFNGEQQPKKKFSLPGGNNLTKLAILIVGGGTILGILIVVLSSVFGPKINKAQIVDVVARAQEISRVSAIVVTKSRDLNTTNLASTTDSVLTGQETELISYLSKNKEKLLTKDISVYLNKKTDTEIQTAEQNNHLSEYYNSYLKKNLTDYQAAIKTAYDSAGGENLKSAINGYSISTQTILKAPQLATVN